MLISACTEIVHYLFLSFNDWYIELCALPKDKKPLGPPVTLLFVSVVECWLQFCLCVLWSKSAHHIFCDCICRRRSNSIYTSRHHSVKCLLTVGPICPLQSIPNSFHLDLNEPSWFCWVQQFLLYTTSLPYSKELLDVFLLLLWNVPPFWLTQSLIDNVNCWSWIYLLCGIVQFVA